MAKQISGIRTSVAPIAPSSKKRKALRPDRSPNIDPIQSPLPIQLDPIPESTASLRKKLKEKRRQIKQRKQQIKFSQHQTTQGATRRPPPQQAPYRWPETSNPADRPRARSLALSSAVNTLTPRPISPKPHRWRPLRRLGIGLGMVGIACLGGWIALEVSLPNTRYAASETSIRGGTLTMKSADGTILFQSGPASRRTVKIDQIPQQLQDAFIATEDRRFFQHDGIDEQGILRAVITNVMSRDLAEGGSTITQQLARMTYLNQERSILRKLKEARLSQKIEGKLSKAEILERYLNQVYLGSGAYGVADAAWVYFGKSLDRLNLQESATLAGLPAAPSLYSPLQNPDVAQERRNLVLQRMIRTQAITPQAAAIAQKSPVVLNAKQSPLSQDPSPYFSAYVQDQLPKILPEDVLKQGGLTIETTLNAKWQQAATTAVKDVVYKDGYAQRFDQAALVAIDPRNGEIKAMVGGNDYEQSQFNRATQAQRQPGSTFKAFVYTAAIAAGLSPHDGYEDAPLIVDGYRPKNYNHTYKGWMSITQALAKSANIPAVRAFIEVGFKPTINLAHELGIQSPLQPYYSTALGANEVTLLELTRAYGSIAAQGFRTQPHSIQSVTDRRGQTLYETQGAKKRVLDPSSAAITTWMLQQVVTSGTGKPAQLKRPVAGKTGTSENNRDLWFVGYIPQLVAGVWLGNDDNYPTLGTSATAAHTWGQFMQRATADIPVQKFPGLPNLEGRKGSIKAQPVRPKRMRNLPLPDQHKLQPSSENAPPPVEEDSQHLPEEVVAYD